MPSFSYPFFYRDTMIIDKNKYKQLVDQSIDYMKQKVLIRKLEQVIAEKCKRVKELTKRIAHNKYLLKKNGPRKNTGNY